MTKIISLLLAYIQIQQKIIVYLIVLMTNKNISPKSDVPISKKYQLLQNVNISHQTVLNYAEAASKLVKPFVDNYPYDLSGSFCGDETYLKIKGKWQYLFFFFDVVKKLYSLIESLLNVMR